jgi:hypothetical protein
MIAQVVVVHKFAFLESPIGDRQTPRLQAAAALVFAYYGLGGPFVLEHSSGYLMRRGRYSNIGRMADQSGFKP